MSGVARRRAGIVGGIAGLGAAAVATGLAVERYAVGRYHRRPDPEAGQPFGRLPADRRRTVRAGDQTPLYVEEVGSSDAGLTVVFVHGYVNSLGTWHYQRLGLADMANPELRMVFYDQRGHGRSGRGSASASTIEQLAEDLVAVLDTVDGGRPVVLVAHSMGGMTVLALADAHPEMFGSRICGVALLCTSPGKLAEVTLGLPAALARVKNPILPRVVKQLGRQAGMAERGRKAGADLVWLVARRMGFGAKDVSSALVDYLAEVIATTPIRTIADFYPALMAHDKLAALPVLRRVPVLVVAGGRDLLTPPDHGRQIAAELPEAELLIVEEAGHMVMLERPALVNLHLRTFLHRAYRQAGGGRPRRRRKA
jgi:pimeloyl-ACP methyl ester carboxylesterase